MFFLAIFCVSSALQGTAAAKNFAYYEPKVTRLSGYVTIKKFYDQAPPYYGENTKVPKVELAVFIPDRPIDVVATARSGPNQDTYFRVRMLELESPASLDLKSYLGRHVHFVGMLFQSLTGNEYTDVVFYVTSGGVSPR